MDIASGFPCQRVKVLHMDLPPERSRAWNVFTAHEAMALDWSEPSLRTACGRQLLTKMRPGVYVEAALMAARDPREQHATRVAAEQLALGSHHFVARRSAAFLWGLPLIGDPPDVPQLLVPRADTKTRPHSRHVRRAPLPAADRRVIAELPSVSAARLVADIARSETFRNAVVVADAALARGMPLALLVECLGRMRRWPGVAKARAVAEFADGLSESALESISRVAIHDLGLPAPELQIEVWLGDRLLGRADKLWRSTNTIGEDDGIAKFGETDAQRAAAFRASKERQDSFEDVGFEVARWGWSEAWRPTGVLDARLLRAFERERRQELDPRVRLVPTTVADRLRRAA